jgi:hypothetical protein
MVSSNTSDAISETSGVLRKEQSEGALQMDELISRTEFMKGFSYHAPKTLSPDE